MSIKSFHNRHEDHEIAKLKWDLVVLNKRSWTALSIMVLAITGLGFISRTPLFTPTAGLLLGAIGLAHGVYWLYSLHLMSVISKKVSAICVFEVSLQSRRASLSQPAYPGPAVLRLQERAPQAGQ